MPTPVKKHSPKTVLSTNSNSSWKVILLNCYCHSFEEAVEQICKAIKCSEHTASKFAQVADSMGSVTVYHGSESDCNKVADILGATGLQVDVTH